MHLEVRTVIIVIVIIFFIVGSILPTMGANLEKQEGNATELWILHTDDNFRNAILTSINPDTGSVSQNLVFPHDKPILPFIQWIPEGDYLVVLVGESNEYRTLVSDSICVYHVNGQEIFCKDISIAGQPMDLVGGFEPIPPHWSVSGESIYVVSSDQPNHSNQLSVVELNKYTGEILDQHFLDFTTTELSKWLWDPFAKFALVQIWTAYRTPTFLGETSLHAISLADYQTNELMSDVYIKSEIVGGGFIYSALGDNESINVANLNGNTDKISLPPLTDNRDWSIGDSAISNDHTYVAVENRWLELIDNQDIRVALLIINMTDPDWTLIEKAGQDIDNISFSPDNTYLSARTCGTPFENSCNLVIYNLDENTILNVDLDFLGNSVIRQVIWD